MRLLVGLGLVACALFGIFGLHTRTSILWGPLLEPTFNDTANRSAISWGGAVTHGLLRNGVDGVRASGAVSTGTTTVREQLLSKNLPSQRCGSSSSAHPGSCDCSSDHQMFCNERNGWCGSTPEHKAGSSGAYDCQRAQRKCSLNNVGLGRWTYEHTGALGKIFNEAIIPTAQWTPLDCILSPLEWSARAVEQCAAAKGISNILTMGGSTSAYILTDFKNWLTGSRKNNLHTKNRTGGVVRSLHLWHMHQSSADPNAGLWAEFLNQNASNTLVLFNSGLWDMRRPRENPGAGRAADIERYAKEVESLARCLPCMQSATVFSKRGVLIQPITACSE